MITTIRGLRTTTRVISIGSKGTARWEEKSFGSSELITFLDNMTRFITIMASNTWRWSDWTPSSWRRRTVRSNSLDFLLDFRLKRSTSSFTHKLRVIDTYSSHHFLCCFESSRVSLRSFKHNIGAIFRMKEKFNKMAD